MHTRARLCILCSFFKLHFLQNTVMRLKCADTRSHAFTKIVNYCHDYLPLSVRTIEIQKLNILFEHMVNSGETNKEIIASDSLKNKNERQLNEDLERRRGDTKRLTCNELNNLAEENKQYLMSSSSSSSPSLHIS